MSYFDELILKLFRYLPNSEERFWLIKDIKSYWWIYYEKIYCIKCNKYRKFKNLKLTYVFNKSLVLSIICHKCGSNNDTKLQKKKEPTEMLAIIGFIANKWGKVLCSSNFKFNSKSLLDLYQFILS